MAEVSGEGRGKQKFMDQKERRRSSTLKMFMGDYLALSSNQVIQKLLGKYGVLYHLYDHLISTGDHKVVFSDIVIKVNKRNKMQERILLISEGGLYNLDPSSYKCKRRIALMELAQVSTSKLPDNFFALHVPSEYDYLIVSSKKTEIITRLLEVFEAASSKKLPVTFANTFEYTIDSDTVREILFSRVDGGVSTQIYTKK